MFKPLSFSFFANPGVSTKCVPLVARIVINFSLWAAAMISGMSSRSKGSPPENRIAGGLGLALLTNSSMFIRCFFGWFIIDFLLGKSGEANGAFEVAPFGYVDYSDDRT